MSLRVLAGDPVHEEAYQRSWHLTRCSSCALVKHRDETWCGASRPAEFNGLMIIGEGPGATEARLKQPFVGKSGQLLDTLLREAGIERKHTYITNATLCQPRFQYTDGGWSKSAAKSRAKAKKEALASAVEECHDRLRAEIEAVQPRVIVMLGSVAIKAVTGRWVEKVRRVPRFGRNAAGDAIPCPRCDAQMTVAWWKCPARIGKKKCKHANLLQAHLDRFCGEPLVKAYPQLHDQSIVCEGCHAEHRAAEIRIEKRKKRCPVCGGRKTVEESYRTLESDYGVTTCAGLVFRGPAAPDFWKMEEQAKVAVPCTYAIGTYHPASLLREPETKSQKKQMGQFLASAALAHLRKAKRLLEEDARWDYGYRVFPDHYDDASRQAPFELIHREVDALIQNRPYPDVPVSLDVETDEKDPWKVTDIRCVGFHALGMPAFVVNTSGLDVNHPIVSAVSEIIARADTGRALQHGIYDKQVMWHRWGVELGGYTHDTMIAHNAVHPDEPHDLGYLAGIYTDSPPWKPPKKRKGKEIYESSEQLHAYNGRDVYNTSLIAREQLVELDLEKARYVHDLDLAMFHVAAGMERVGLPVDPATYEEWAQRVAFYRHRAQSHIDSFLGYTINLDSPQQLQAALYDPNGPCRLTPTLYTDSGAPSASREALLAYRHHPLVQLVLDYRRWHGAVMGSLFGGKKGGGATMHLGADWRLRTRWNPLGARTGRWSTGGEASGRKGNFQNFTGLLKLLYGIHTQLDRAGEPVAGSEYWLPLFDGDEKHVKAGQTAVDIPGIRLLVAAPPGRKLVGADLSQAELRVLGALSGDEALIDKCVNADERRKLEPEWDPHSFVCEFAFGDAYLSADIGAWDEATESYVGGDPRAKEIRKKLRDVEKRVIYGSFYGAGVATIRESIMSDETYDGPPLSHEDVEKILHAITEAYTRVPVWRQRTYKEASRTGYVWDALIGRRREFPLRKVDPTIAYNFAMQCVRVGTRVLTSEGYLPVEGATCQASIGSPDQWSPSMILAKRRDSVWQTTLANGQTLETNEEHYLRVLRDDRSAFEWRVVGELQPGDRVAQPLAMPQEFGRSAPDPDDPYWIGYWIGNGSWDSKGGLEWCFGNRVGRFSHEQYERDFRRWASRYGGVRRTRWRQNMAQTGVAKDSLVRELLLAWGVDPTWRAKTKRVPDRVWRADLAGRKAFLLGYMDADGTLSTSMPTAHSPNLALLRDLQLLARTCGITSRIDGPYVTDREGREAYHLCFAGSLMRHHLAYGGTPGRQRFSRDGTLSQTARMRFLETYPRNPFSHRTQGSLYVLWSRLAHGGWTNPHTLQRMYEAAGDARDAMLYTTGEVVSVEKLDGMDDMYTLAVEHELHSYDSAGIVSKNSTVGSMMNMSLWELRQRLPAIDSSASIVAQVHDAIYIECDEDKSPLVAELLEQCMSCKLRLVEGAPYMPFPATAKIGDTWQEVS